MSRLGNWFWRPMPATRLATLRFACALYCLIYLAVRIPSFWKVVNFPAARFSGVGPVALLGEPVAPWMASIIYGFAIIASFALVLGWRHRWSAAASFLSVAWVLSYRNSWGMIFHTENLLVVHLAILAAAPASDALAYDARRTTQGEFVDAKYGWPVRTWCIAAVIAYFLAGWAKLAARGVEWGMGETLIRQVAYDNLRKIELGDIHSPAGVVLLDWPWVFAPLAIATLVLELGAPLALVADRLGRWWCIGMWCFHIGVLATMAIFFPYQVLGVAFLGFFACERGWFGRLAARCTGVSRASFG